MLTDSGWILYAIAAFGVGLGVMLASVLARVGSIRHVDFIVSAVLAMIVFAGAVLFFNEISRNQRILHVTVLVADMQRRLADFLVRSAQSGLVSEPEACINLANGAVRKQFSHPDCQLGRSGLNLRYGTPTAEEHSVWYLLHERERSRWEYAFVGDYAELRLKGRAGCALRYAPSPLPGMPALISYEVLGC